MRAVGGSGRRDASFVLVRTTLPIWSADGVWGAASTAAVVTVGGAGVGKKKKRAPAMGRRPRGDPFFSFFFFSSSNRSGDRGQRSSGGPRRRGHGTDKPMAAVENPARRPKRIARPVLRGPVAQKCARQCRRVILLWGIFLQTPTSHETGQKETTRMCMGISFFFLVINKKSPLAWMQGTRKGTNKPRRGGAHGRTKKSGALADTARTQIRHGAGRRGA